MGVGGGGRSLFFIVVDGVFSNFFLSRSVGCYIQPSRKGSLLFGAVKVRKNCSTFWRKGLARGRDDLYDLFPLHALDLSGHISS